MLVSLEFVVVSWGGRENGTEGAGVIGRNGDNWRFGLFTAAAATWSQVEVHEDDNHGHHTAQQRCVPSVE